MAASTRKDLAKKGANIEDKLPFNIKRHVLSFVGKIGTKDFKYSSREFKNKDSQTQFPTFYGNLLVLCSYMDRAEMATTIAINLLFHIRAEEALALARQNPKCLPIPIRGQDPHGQWFEATPLQAVYAAGDRNPPNMAPEAKNFGYVERLRPCFQNPANADKQLAEWKRGSQKATEETMAPYVAAINNICQQIIDCDQITDDVRWEDVLTLPIFLQFDEDFRKALFPNPNHVVRSGFLFSMEIFLHLFKTFQENVNNDNVEDKKRPNLGGWWSRKSDALDAIVYPKLQIRSSRCDLGIFKKGIGCVAEGQIPERLDHTNGTPAVLSGLGSTHFFGFYGDKFGRGAGLGGGRTGAGRIFETCVKQKQR